MSTYGYNEQVADVIRPLGQGKVQNLENGFRSIPNIEISSNAMQNRVDAGRLGTGQIRGIQQIRGQMQVVTPTGNKVMIFGYAKGKF